MNPVEMVLEHAKLPFKGGKLHDYQVIDINRGALEPNFACFHGVGLGKTTISALIAVYKLLTGFDSCYVLCPASIITQWVSVLTKMGVKVAAYVGTPAQRKKIDTDSDFLVMSFQIFQKDRDLLKQKGIYFIVDEATILCNPQNLLFKQLQGGVIEKTKKIPGKLMPVIEKIQYEKINEGCCLLTATPLALTEQAYGLVKVLTPEIYDNYSQFYRLHVAKENHFNQPVEYKNVDLLRDNLMHRASRRLSSDYLDLPPLIQKVIEYDLDPKHLEAYNRMLDERYIQMPDEELVNGLNATSIYHWAQRVIMLPSPIGYSKDSVGFEILDNLVKTDSQYLIFNNYVATNAAVKERYSIGACYGEVNAKERNTYIAAFKAGTLKGLACNPKSGGVGLDFPNCNLVICSELPVTARDYEQLVGRAHRQGNLKTVVAVVLIARKTIQQTLLKRVLEKEDLITRVIDTDGTMKGGLVPNVIRDKPKTREQVFKELRGEI